MEKQVCLEIPGLSIGRRPRINDDAIIKEIAVIMAEKTMPWLKGGNCFFETEDVIEDYLSVFNSFNADSIEIYKTAKFFDEELGWEIDDDFLEVLDNINYVAKNVLNSKIREWVINNNVKPVFNIGDEVTFGRVERGDALTNGLITKISHEDAKYHVNYDKGRTRVLNFEEVRRKA